MKREMSTVSERLSDQQFRGISELIERQVGILLPAAKRTMVEGRLRKRVRALGLASLDQYGTYLFEQGGLNEEVVSLIDCVTTNKTDFFREPAHFEFLCKTALPDLLDRGAGRPLKVWSAACSTGAEAYTAAMVLQDQVRAGARFTFSILGTDISTDVLDQAEKAIYPKGMMEPVPEPVRQRYVMSSKDPSQGLVRIVPELRRLVQFHRLYLMDPAYPFDRALDVIFCRNVLIYFDKPTQKTVIKRLASHLRVGGYLMLGHSESMTGAEELGLTPVLPSIFQALP